MAIWSKQFWAVPALAILTVTAACGGEKSSETAAPAASETTAEAPATAPAADAAAPAAEGQVIEVRMVMPAGSNPRFEPAQITAKPGDVIRFVNVENVHNISFPQDKNAGASSLPAPSPFLTAPNQTYELKVELAPGTYTFQCDPHAAMGMVGTLTVTQ